VAELVELSKRCMHQMNSDENDHITSNLPDYNTLRRSASKRIKLQVINEIFVKSNFLLKSNFII